MQYLKLLEILMILFNKKNIMTFLIFTLLCKDCNLIDISLI